MTKRRKKGFGLLEVLLAGVIIIMMMSALVIVARAAIQNSQYLQQRSQATFIAQEKMEMVRQIRDTHYIDQTNATQWDNWNWKTDSSPTTPPTSPPLWYTVDDSGVQDYRFLFRCTTVNTVLQNCLKTESWSTMLDVLDGTTYSSSIIFQKIDPNQISGLLTSPKINDIPSSRIAYLCIVTTSWNGKNVQIKEVITNSRQGF